MQQFNAGTLDLAYTAAGNIDQVDLNGDAGSPGARRPYVAVPIVTGLGYARNAIVARTGRAVIAIGGSYGTLSEIAFACQSGIPVVGLQTWSFAREGVPDESVVRVDSPADAVDAALSLARARSS